MKKQGLKRITATALAVITAMSLVGCGSGEGKESESISKTDNGTLSASEKKEESSDKGLGGIFEKEETASKDNYVEGEDILSYINKNASDAYSEYLELEQKADFDIIPHYEEKKVTVGDFDYIFSEKEKLARCFAYHGTEKHVVFPAEVDGYRVLDIRLTKQMPDYKNIESITVEEGILGIHSSYDSETGQMGFDNMHSLQNVNLPSSLVATTELFNYARNLEEIVLPSNLFFLSGLEDCDSLKNITIPASVAYIGGLRDCDELTEVKFESNDGLLAVGVEALDDCSKLASCTLPDSVRIIGSGAFANTALEEFHVPAELRDAGYGARADWKHRDSRVLEGTPYEASIEEDFLIWNDKYLVGYYGDDANVVVPDGVTHVFSYAFADNDVIEDIQFPESTIYVQRMALTNLNGLKSMTIPGDVVQWGDEYGNAYAADYPDEFNVTLKKGSAAEAFFAKKNYTIEYK